MTLRRLSYREVARRLRRLGYISTTQRGSHVKWVRETARGRRVVIVPRTGEIAIGTLKSILRQIGSSWEEFEDL